jgi:hypothetical protein
VLAVIALLALDDMLISGLGSVAGIVFAVALGVEGGARLLSAAYVRQRITVTADEVRSVLVTPLGRFRMRAIPLEVLETVRQVSLGGRWRVAGYAFGARDRLSIESDSDVITVSGLSKRPRDWLEGFVVAAIAGAPRG